MDKKSLSFCFQVLLACVVFVGWVMFAYQKPKELTSPFYVAPYVEIAYTENKSPSSSKANPSLLLDASPLFLATECNGSCLPALHLPLSNTLPLENALEPFLSLSQKLKILPLQPTLLSEPAELALWSLSINLALPSSPDNLYNQFIGNQENIQILSLLHNTRTTLSLDFNLEDKPLPILEDLELLLLRDCSGYTLPSFKRNTLGDEVLDQMVLEGLIAIPPSYSSQAIAYEEYRISL